MDFRDNRSPRNRERLADQGMTVTAATRTFDHSQAFGKATMRQMVSDLPNAKFRAMRRRLVL
jgi:hypothetical protein